MSEDRNGKTYSFDVCSLCKLMCCQGANPPLTNSRKKTIETYLDEKEVFFRSFFVQEDYAHPAADAEDFCMLYSRENGKCRVHPVKPETCRAGPITFDIDLKTGKIEWFLKKSEICALAGILYENPVQFKEHFEVAKVEIMRLVCELDSVALRALLRIPEPQTFKIGENELPQNVLNKLVIA
jgi:Fe-S-cluster containining protein